MPHIVNWLFCVCDKVKFPFHICINHIYHSYASHWIIFSQTVIDDHCRSIPCIQTRVESAWNWPMRAHWYISVKSNTISWCFAFIEHRERCYLSYLKVCIFLLISFSLRFCLAYFLCLRCAVYCWDGAAQFYDCKSSIHGHWIVA